MPSTFQMLALGLAALAVLDMTGILKLGSLVRKQDGAKPVPVPPPDVDDLEYSLDYLQREYLIADEDAEEAAEAAASAIATRDAALASYMEALDAARADLQKPEVPDDAPD